MPITNLEVQGLFTSKAITDAIYRLPIMPTPMMSSGLFGEAKNLTTTYFNLEYKDNSYSILDSVPRDGVENTVEYVGSVIETVQVPHYPVKGVIMASQIQDFIPFGGVAPVSNAQDVINEYNTARVNDINATMEYGMINTVMGVLLKKNGDVLFDFYAKSGITRPVVDFGVVNENTNITKKIMEVFALASQSVNFVTMRALCGKNAFAKLQENKEIASWKKNQVDSTEFMKRSPFQSIFYQGVLFEFYNNKANTRGTEVKIPDDEIYFIPDVGNGQLFGRVFAPGTSADAINRPAIPYYASVERMSHGKGWEILHETNFFPYMKKPDAIIKATLA